MQVVKRAIADRYNRSDSNYPSVFGGDPSGVNGDVASLIRAGSSRHQDERRPAESLPDGASLLLVVLAYGCAGVLVVAADRIMRIATLRPVMTFRRPCCATVLSGSCIELMLDCDIPCAWSHARSMRYPCSHICLTRGT